MTQARAQLQQRALQWADYHCSTARFSNWLHSAEETVKDLHLMSSLAEKQQQLRAVEVNFLELLKTLKNIKKLKISFHLLCF